MYKSIQCGPHEVKLRYNVKSLLSIRDTAAKVIGPDRLAQIKYKPMDGKVPAEIVVNLLGEMDIMLWLFGKGLDWKDSGAKPDEAADLFDAYMDVDEAELDTGERFETFQMTIASAIAAARGVDLKKTIEKRKADQEAANAKIERLIKENGAGNDPGETASVS